MSPVTMSLWMPCFLNRKSKSVLAKPLEHQCSRSRYRLVEAQTQGGSRHPMSRIQRSFATKLPFELAQCTSRSRSRQGAISQVLPSGSVNEAKER
jgi:hypothetical protein